MKAAERRQSVAPGVSPGLHQRRAALSRVNELAPEARESVAPAERPGFRTRNVTAPAGRKSRRALLLRASSADLMTNFYPGLTAGATFSRPSGPNSFTRPGLHSVAAPRLRCQVQA
jgi:hypothetical protein